MFYKQKLCAVFFATDISWIGRTNKSLTVAFKTRKLQLLVN